MINIEKFFHEINRVYHIPNLKKIRIGRKRDGGYVLFKELCEKTKVVYTVGVGDDVSFELDFIKKFPNTEVVCLCDPTIEKLPVENDKFIFSKSSIDAIGEVHENSLLKVDMEWNEWEAFSNLNKEFFKKFNQIVIELHLFTADGDRFLSPYFTKLYSEVDNKINSALFQFYYQVLKSLNDLFYIYHIHPNNSLPKTQMGKYSFPPLLEVSFINKECVDFGILSGMEEKTKRKKGLDYPNKLDRPDIVDFFPIGEV
jgi:hypothetical protein